MSELYLVLFFPSLMFVLAFGHLAHLMVISFDRVLNGRGFLLILVCQLLLVVLWLKIYRFI